MAEDPKPKRAGTMGDDARALIGSKHRAQTQPGIAVPEAVPTEDSMPILIDHEDTPPAGPRAIHRPPRGRPMTSQQFVQAAWTEIRELRKAVADCSKDRANELFKIVERIVVIEQVLKNAAGLSESVEELQDLHVSLAELKTQLFGIEDDKKDNGKLGELEQKANTGRNLAFGAAGVVISAVIAATAWVYSLTEKTTDSIATMRTKLEAGQRERTQMQQQINLLLRYRGSADPGFLTP